MAGRPGFDSAAALAACYDIARSANWQKDSAVEYSADAVTPEALRFFDVAKMHAAGMEMNGEDPSIVVRAVQYIAHVHATPQTSGDGVWFGYMLEALLEIVRACSGPSPQMSPFLRDVQRSVSQQLSEECDEV